jgi:hypothetical protein
MGFSDRWSWLAAIGLIGCGSDPVEASAPTNDAARSEASSPDAKTAKPNPADASTPRDSSALNHQTPRDASSLDVVTTVNESSVDGSPPPEASSSETGVPQPAPTGNVAAPSGFVWQVIPELSDEFDGSALDATKWIPSHPYWQGRPPSQFDPANVFVSGGELGLVSTTIVDSLSTVANPDQDIWVKSACVSSKASTASYGYYEARMKASDLSMTSSFWFQGTYSEIDVVEELGRPAINPADNLLMQMNTHYFAAGWANDVATPKQWQMPTGAADGYHVYGVWWRDKSSVWFFHDGQKVAEIVPGGDFAETMYLFFDTEVFTWYGLPTIASLKDPTLRTMRVDWVRAWRAVPDGSG